MRCRQRAQGLAVRSSDPARGELAGGLAWQLGRGPGHADFPLPDRTAGPIGSSGSTGTAEGPASSFPSLASHVETVAPDTGFPVRMSQSEVSESALVPLVNQFSMMQQQMFDQFQQAMGMLVQMFGTMHREQMEVIREELDRLHQLSKELQDLKDELAKSSRQPVAPSGEAAAMASTSPPSPSPANVAPSIRTANAPIAGVRAPGMPEPDRTPTSTPPMAPRLDRSRPAAAVPPASKATADADRDTVAWLHERIMTIQSERETRWQKILKLLPGIS